MLCPKCQNSMREREEGDVVIDVCPACHGVWLDAGELEKLIASESRFYDWNDEDVGEGDSKRLVDQRGRVEEFGPSGEIQKRKQKGFLSNIFESFGEGDEWP